MMIQDFMANCLSVLVWIVCVVVGGAFVGVGVRCVGGLLMASLLETKRKCGVWGASLLLAVALVCTVVAQKDGGANTNVSPEGASQGTNEVTQVDGGTNDWTNIEGTNTIGQTDAEGTNGTGSVSGPLMLGGRMGALSLGLPPQDFPSLEPFAVRPANAVENHWWRGRGAHVDGLTIPAEGWNFRTPSGFLESLLVYSYGEIQPDVETTYFPRPFPEADLSLLPEGKWGGNLPEGAECLFWHAASPSNSLILTWQNAAYGRDASCPTNLQIELFSNGTYVYRFDDRTEYHSVAYPFDWDSDGLENSVDPDPLVAGSDAHGTNAGWYDMVCSNVFTRVEQSNNPNNSNNQPILLPNGESVYFKSGINTNAYYFVDVTAERGPAPIYFNSSHPGRLGSPIVVALGGETNRVPMLIGATYSITSDVPFTVLCPTNGFAQVLGSDVTSVTVKWPLEFTFTEELTGTSRSYTVGVEPYNPGGVFAWGTQMNAGPSLQGALLNSEPICRCCHGNGNTVVFSCSPDCTCHGGCHASGSFVFEFASFEVVGGVCRCGFDELPPATPPSCPEPNAGPSLSIEFSRPVLVFEDEYENYPDDWRLSRSTRVNLAVSAYGGTNGCVVSFSSENLGKLSTVGGTSISLPREIRLSAGESFFSSCVYEAIEASTNVDDIVVSGTLDEIGTSLHLTDSQAVTAAQLTLTVEYAAPENPCSHRHVYGVGERVRFALSPVMPTAMLSVRKVDSADTNTVYDTFENSSQVDLLQERVYTCAVADTGNPNVVLTVGDVYYRPKMKLIEPQEVITREAMWGENIFDYSYPGNRKCWSSGVVGSATLVTHNYVGPMTVSFQGIAMAEVPCAEEDLITGCFTNRQGVYRTHSWECGAGRARNVGAGNEWFYDYAGSTRPEYDWSPESRFNWKIPVGWYRQRIKNSRDITYVYDPDHERTDDETSRPLIIGNRLDLYMQNRYIDTVGTYRTEKFGHWISRSRTCRVILDGEVLQERHVEGNQ